VWRRVGPMACIAKKEICIQRCGGETL